MSLSDDDAARLERLRREYQNDPSTHAINWLICQLDAALTREILLRDALLYAEETNRTAAFDFDE